MDIDLLTIGWTGNFDNLVMLPELPVPNRPVSRLNGVPDDLHNIYFGGCSFNIAVAGRRLGLRTGVINPVGRDFKPSGYWDYLSSIGVALDGLIIREETLSGQCYILHDLSGNTYTISYSISDSLIPKDPQDFYPLLQCTANVAVTSYANSFSLELVRYAASLGCTIIVSSPFRNPQKDGITREMLSFAKIAFFNKHEAKLLEQVFGLQGPEGLLKLGPGMIYVTHGKEGSSLYTRKGIVYIPSVPAQAIIDPTGAGDAFTGGVITGLEKGYPPEIAAQIGAVVASYVVEMKGCQTNLPDWEKMLTRYRTVFGELHK
jgi:sugar/nucleoside kinase (ribokinase family)